MIAFFNYLIQNNKQISYLLLEHIQLTVISISLAILIGVPLGILISYVKRLNKPVLATVNLIQAVPSIALLGFAIPFLGIGKLPAVVVVVLYSLLAIVKNTFTGLSNINPNIIESSRGIGLTDFQILSKIQIPLALPMIMAGIRISAVTAVGLVTIAAFIGAGGLGFSVFTGIATLNNHLILAGAIPACLLALLVDYLAALVEKNVSPKNSKLKETGKKRKTFSLKFLTIILSVITIISFISLFNFKTDQNKIVVAGKNYTEQHIIAHLLSEIIEHNTDIKVERKVNLGGTQVCFEALKKGAVDLYVDYTGTLYSDVLNYPPRSDVGEIFQTVKTELDHKFKIIALKPMSFNNTYTLSTTKSIAEKYNLKTISDLALIAGNLKIASTFEFFDREDGLNGLEMFYNFSFGQKIAIDGSQRYIALNNNEVDFIDAFSTEGLLKKFQLQVLEDDKNFFPPYYAVPLIRAEIAAQYPEIIPLLEKLGDNLTVETMIALNYEVDENSKNPQQVALDFLKEKKLID